MLATMSRPRLPRRAAEAAPPSTPYATRYHAPVLAEEVLDLLVTDRAGVYVDGTLGGGGHAAALLDALAPQARVLGIDQDEEALEEARRRLDAHVVTGRFRALHGNFEAMEALLAHAGVGPVDGVLLDLGVSSHQIDAAGRGFAFSAEGPLDMRMDRAQPVTAATLVNDAEPEELIRLLRQFGEEPRAPRIVRAIVERRPLGTTAELAAAVRAAVPVKEEVKALARTFQALRIAVNDEMGVLERALEAALAVLRPGGRLAVIAYHSLEDRRVKHFLRAGNLQGQVARDFYGNALTPWTLVTRKAVVAGEKETAANPRARSARLRVAEKRAAVEPQTPEAPDAR